MVKTILDNNEEDDKKENTPPPSQQEQPQQQQDTLYHCGVNDCQTSALTHDSLVHHKKKIHGSPSKEREWFSMKTTCEYCKVPVLYADYNYHVTFICTNNTSIYSCLN
jgi:hypothetical protein